MFNNFKFYKKQLQKKFLNSIKKRFVKITYNKNQKNFTTIISNLSSQNQNIIYFHHNLGGGSDLYIQNKIAEYRTNHCIFVVVYMQKIKQFAIQATFGECFGSILLSDFEVVVNFFRGLKIDKIYISQIIFFPNIEAIFNFTKQSKNIGSQIIMLVHDYYSICKRVFLIKPDGTECNIANNKYYCDCDPLAQDHIKRWEKFLTNQADEIICFSQSSHKIIGQFYPAISNKIKVIPHYVPFLRKANVVKGDSIIRIATIGFMHKAKGCDVIREMSEIIMKNSLLVRIVAIGRVPVKTNKAIKVLGKYDREDLPEIVENNEIDLVFISSICNETFNYTAHEAMMMGIKVACFDLGAQAEYIKKYDQGLIISKIDAQTALDEILNFVKIN